MNQMDEQRLRQLLSDMADEVGATAPLTEGAEKKARVKRGITGSLAVLSVLVAGFVLFQGFQGISNADRNLTPAGAPLEEPSSDTTQQAVEGSKGELVAAGEIEGTRWSLTTYRNRRGEICAEFNFNRQETAGTFKACDEEGVGPVRGRVAYMSFNASLVEGIGLVGAGHVEAAVDEVVIETQSGEVEVPLLAGPDRPRVRFIALVPLPEGALAIVARIEGREVWRYPIIEGGPPCPPMAVCGSEEKSISCDEGGCDAVAEPCDPGLEPCGAYEKDEEATPQGEPCGDGPGCSESGAGTEECSAPDCSDSEPAGGD